MVRRLRSPASVVLAREGVLLKEVAAALGITSAAVSMHLSGQRRPHPSLFPVLSALAGAEAADEIRSILSNGGGR